MLTPARDRFDRFHRFHDVPEAAGNLSAQLHRVVEPADGDKDLACQECNEEEESPCFKLQSSCITKYLYDKCSFSSSTSPSSLFFGRPTTIQPHRQRLALGGAGKYVEAYCSAPRLMACHGHNMCNRSASHVADLFFQPLFH